MSLLRELFEAKKAPGSLEEYGAAYKRQRDRFSAALKQLLAKEFPGNDYLQDDLHWGMMKFYNDHFFQLQADEDNKQGK
jgi:hypothetical protein